MTLQISREMRWVSPIIAGDERVIRKGSQETPEPFLRFFGRNTFPSARMTKWERSLK